MGEGSRSFRRCRYCGVDLRVARGGASGYGLRWEGVMAEE